MAPTVKDLENPAVSATPAIPASSVAKPQPVPLEIPVSVNGARTIEGSDKREPFSESTKTVLVFANGAVIRLASNVAAGQLLFVTNDKTKKEVVCQVVKSKNYRTVTGYVELEFTEPAAGFWGVRIPADASQVSAGPKAPVAAPRPPAPATVVPPASALPKVAAPAPTNISVAPPVHTVVPPVPDAAKPVAPAPVATPPATAATSVPVDPATPPRAAPVNPNSLSAQLAAQFSSLVGSESPVAPSQTVPPVAATPAAPQQSSDASTEELKKQAARLQEQLSSLLFRESAADKPGVPSTSPIPTPHQSVGSTQPHAAIPEAIHPPVAREVAKVEAHTEPIKVAPISAPVQEIKTPPAVSKTPSISLSVEEVKIPSWLAPLAREAETTKETSSALTVSTSTNEETSYKAADEVSAGLSDDSSHKSESVVFGGQLLAGSDSTEAKASAPGSKKGLVFGLIAATVLAGAGGAWYGLQPGNFLASKPASVATVQHPAPASSQSVAKPDVVPAAPSNSQNPVAQPAASLPASSRPAASVPVSTLPAETSRNTNFTSTPIATPPSANAARSAAAAAVETPKKPVLGDVRLATPNVNRGTANPAGADAAPSIDTGGVTSAGDPLAGLAVSNSKQPSAPLPIGGDVKPAKLLKSVPPVYPPAARSQRIGGNVQLDALIDAAGNVTTTKVISGPPLLHQAAITAVKQWKYEPAQLDGKATSMHLTVTVQFRLQ
jgi:TonB family protein